MHRLTTLSGVDLVADGNVLHDAWIRVEGSRILDFGQGRPGAEGSCEYLPGVLVLPGFVDLHMHGGGGHGVDGALPDVRAAVDFHRRHGTTTTLVSLVSAPVEVLSRQLSALAGMADHGVHGVHVEGPFLSPQQAGAQDATSLLSPDLGVFDALHKAAGGTLRVLTLAPELPGALELVGHAVGCGVVVALGHSASTYDEALACFDAGASLVTHAFNAMAPLHHRDPGLVGAALARGVPCELINDGVHLHPAVVRLLLTACPRPVLVTDACPAAGCSDGAYRLGRQAVEVRDGQARLASDGVLAGSTLTMDRALRTAVQQNGLPLPKASAAASAHPAAVLGLGGRIGRVARGLDADLVLLSPGLEVLRVMQAGVWVHTSG